MFAAAADLYHSQGTNSTSQARITNDYQLGQSFSDIQYQESREKETFQFGQRCCKA